MCADTLSRGKAINTLRQRLDQLDTRILELIAERQQIVTTIGETKHEKGQSLRDFAREQQVIERGVRKASELGLPGEVARDILERLIHHSLTRQEHRRISASGHGQGHRALVIGGLGRMGDWVARYLDTLGYSVEIADPGEGESLFPRVSDWRSTDLAHEVIVVAAPLRASNLILQELADSRPAGLVFDVGSLKGPLRPGLEALRNAGCRVCSVHPMFGPDALMLSGRHILFVAVDGPDSVAEARALFAHTAAECVELDLEEHDKVMAWVLGLSHIINIAFAVTLSTQDESIPLLRQISSSTFDAQLGIASQVISENPRLYFEIQRGARHGPEVSGRFAAALEDLMSAVRSDDEENFVKLMETALQHLTEKGGAQ
jgi:chorismate mutase/prephenate dehydrogenase